MLPGEERYLQGRLAERNIRGWDKLGVPVVIVGEVPVGRENARRLVTGSSGCKRVSKPGRKRRRKNMKVTIPVALNKLSLSRPQLAWQLGKKLPLNDEVRAR